MRMRHMQKEYTVQNMGFYVFLNLGLCLWAFGIRVPATSVESAVARLAAVQADDAAAAGALQNPSSASSRNTPPAAHADKLEAEAAAVWQRGMAWNMQDYLLASAPPLTLALYLLGAAVIHSKVIPHYMQSCYS